MSISLEHAEWLFISIHMASCARPYTIGAYLLAIAIFAKAGLSLNYSRLLCVGGHNHSKSIQKLKSTLHWWHMH